MPTNGNIQVIATVGSTLTQGENRRGEMFDAIREVYTFTDGTGASQNDLVWSDRRTVGAGATDTIDLNGGGLTNVFGAAVNFVDVTGIVIRNRETTAATRILHFGPAAANPFLWTFVDASDLEAIHPGATYAHFFDTGVTAVAGASDQIRLINTDGANTVEYDILIIGRSL